MNYAREPLLDLLAAEYAGGTLVGAARRRFERLCRTHPGVRTALHRWEDRFAALSLREPAVAPRARVWAAVRERAGSRRSATHPASG
jgi:anti-sigma-K factor RskA